MEWSEGDLVWFDPGLGHPLPGEIQEVHRAAQVIIVQALINGKVSSLIRQLLLFGRWISITFFYTVIGASTAEKMCLIVMFR